MPAVDDPFGMAASMPGQLAELRRQLKDLSVNRTFAPNIFTVGAGGLTVLGPSALNGPVTFGAGVTGPVAATGPVSGTALSGTSIAVTGAATSATSAVSGAASVGGTSTLGPINSTYSRAHTVVSGYANAYWDGNGDGGVNVSSVVYKQDVVPVNLSPEVKAILSLALVRFRYISAVEEHGDNAPVEIGSIAEYVEALGLGEWVFRDAEGTVQGISYERLTIPLIAVVQSLDKRLKALEGR